MGRILELNEYEFKPQLNLAAKYLTYFDHKIGHSNTYLKDFYEDQIKQCVFIAWNIMLMVWIKVYW